MLKKIASWFQKSPPKGQHSQPFIHQHYQQPEVAAEVPTPVGTENSPTASIVVKEEIVSAEEIHPTPEELCGITAEMSQEEIRSHLAILYRRYNRSASSLDLELCRESEGMLEAIVHIREHL
jgi:hypothetical protein